MNTLPQTNALRSNVPAVLTVPEAAIVLTLGKRTVWQMIADGKITVIRIGKTPNSNNPKRRGCRVLIARAELENLIGSKLA